MNIKFIIYQDELDNCFIPYEEWGGKSGHFISLYW